MSLNTSVKVIMEDKLSSNMHITLRMCDESRIRNDGDTSDEFPVFCVETAFFSERDQLMRQYSMIRIREQASYVCILFLFLFLFSIAFTSR